MDGSRNGRQIRTPVPPSPRRVARTQGRAPTCGRRLPSLFAVDDSLPPIDPTAPLARLRRLVHDLANAVQAQDLAWFHRGAHDAAAEAHRLEATAVAQAASALLAHHPATDDDWDDVVLAVRRVQQELRALRARLEPEPE